jgi:hypothetical protein
VRKIQFSLAACAGLLLLSTTRSAHADVSAWVFTGGGIGYLKQHALSINPGGVMMLEAGMGTSQQDPLILGGSLQLSPFFGHGSDLALLARLATRGYINGGFGLALEVGPYERFWGEGSAGGVSNLFLGAPWGITLGASGSYGSNDARGVSLLLGLDFMRLTVFRSTGTSWLPNPFPANREENH